MYTALLVKKNSEILKEDFVTPESHNIRITLKMLKLISQNYGSEVEDSYLARLRGLNGKYKTLQDGETDNLLRKPKPLQKKSRLL